MPSSYPTGLDAFTTGTLTGIVSGSDHGNKGDALNKIEAELGISPSGVAATVAARLDTSESGRPVIAATADGSNVTATILAGLETVRGGRADRNKGGGALAPGVYGANALALSQSYQTLEGAGLGAELKAVAGAPHVVEIVGKRTAALRRLTIDGNAKASHGVKIIATVGGPGAEQALLEHLSITNCDHGIHIVEPASGVVTQSDKHVYTGCFINASNVGMYLDAENAQQQTLVGCHFESNAVDIELQQGGLAMIGGSLGGTGTGIDITGLLGSSDAMYGIQLEHVITEGHALTIDGTTGWPRLGVTLKQSTFGATECINMGVDSVDADGYPPFLTAEHCDFATGDVVLAGDDVVFYDYFNRYREGAAVVRTGARCRHIQWNADGLTIYYGNTLVYQRKTSGATRRKRNVQSTNYTATVDDYYVGINDTSVARTVTLPAVASAGMGFELIVKDESNNAAVNNITVDGNASETVDGNVTKVINTNYGSMRLLCTGSSWMTT